MLYDKYHGLRGVGLLKAPAAYTVHPGLDIVGNKVII